MDRPEVTLFLDLNFGPTKYKDFCSSAQDQANKAFAEDQKALSALPPGTVLRELPPGSSFSNGAEFDWSKYPSGPFSLLYIYIFKTKERFEEYAKGKCIDCSWVGDMTLNAVVTSKDLKPSFQVKTDGVGIEFLARLDMRPEIKSTNIMSIPDLQSAVVAIHDPTFFEVLTPKSIFIDTPRGQRMEADFQSREVSSMNYLSREVSNTKLFFAEFSKK